MDLITDGLLVAGTVFAGTYCWVLSRRVKALMSLDRGLGGAITALTRQIAQAETALAAAKAASREGKDELRQAVAEAQTAAGQLRMLIAATRAPGPAARRDARPAAPGATTERPSTPSNAAIRPVRLSEVAGPAAAKPAPDVPKPRAIFPLDPVLFRRNPAQPQTPPAMEAPAGTEAELMAALDAIAAGGR